MSSVFVRERAGDAGLDTEFREYVGQVSLHGARRHEQRSRDLLVRIPAATTV
jgi:hypothetical protein